MLFHALFNWLAIRSKSPPSPRLWRTIFYQRNGVWREWANYLSIRHTSCFLPFLQKNSAEHLVSSIPIAAFEEFLTRSAGILHKQTSVCVFTSECNERFHVSKGNATWRCEVWLRHVKWSMSSTLFVFFARMCKKMAEGVGFEPTVDYSTAVFKTAALNHSTTPPGKSRALKDCPRKVFFKLKNELI